jgi:hypothetical protein
MISHEGLSKMTTSSTFAPHFGPTAGKSNVAAVWVVGQHILNLLTAAPRRLVENRRLAALPRRYLDDAGIALSDLDAALPGMDPFFPRNARNILERYV